MAYYEDASFPESVVARLTDEALDKKVKITSEARTALASCAVLFLHHLTSSSSDIASQGNRRRLRGVDIISAAKKMELGDFNLEEELERYKTLAKEESPLSKKMLLDESGPSGTGCDDSMDISDDSSVEDGEREDT